jgi:hypothetical protein
MSFLTNIISYKISFILSIARDYNNRYGNALYNLYIMFL